MMTQWYRRERVSKYQREEMPLISPSLEEYQMSISLVCLVSISLACLVCDLPCCEDVLACILQKDSERFEDPTLISSLS